MRILKLLLVLGSIAGATSITSAVGGNPNPLLTTGDIWAGTTNGAPTNLPAGASGTFLGSNGIGIAPTYQLINYSSLTGTVPTWNQSTTGSAATLTTPRTIATSGDAVGTATSFNGSANISIPTTVVAVNGAAVPASKTIVGTNASSQIVDASAATLANNTTGSAAKWTTPRTLAWTSDATGSMSVDGSGNASTALTLATVNSNVGSYGAASTVPVVTVNAKGLVTAVSTATITPAAIGAMPLWSTSNAIPKGNGSTGLTASSLTDNGTTVTTAEPLVLTGGTGFAAGSGLQINTANPAINMSATGMGTDTKNWVWWTSGSGTSGSLNLTAYNDAFGTGPNAVTIARTGATVGTIAFGGTGITANAATIGSGTGTAILTSGVVSTLSGTNLVLGNGSTIPQSTFQPALSGGTTGALTKWTGSSTLGNAAWPDIQTAIGSQGAGLALMGPTSGPNASPAFRSIINTDLGSVAWGGSLAGTGPNPDVRGIWGLSVPTPTAGNLRYNGSAYAWDGTSYATSASLGSYLPLVAGSGNPLSGELYASASGPAISTPNGGITAGSSGTNVGYVQADGAGSSVTNSAGSGPWIGVQNTTNIGWIQQLNASNTWDIYNLTGSGWGSRVAWWSPGGALTATGTITSNATGTAINASNGDISTGGEIILASAAAYTGAGTYTQPFTTSNAIQYYDGGGGFTLTAPSASGLTGKTFRICARGATIPGFPTGTNTYYTSPGPLLSLGQCLEMYSDGTKWSYR